MSPFHASAMAPSTSAAVDKQPISAEMEVAGRLSQVLSSAAAPVPGEHPAHVYATETDAGGTHNCPRCRQLVIWGLTTKGKRARFDYPADIEGRHANHHITCLMSPGKARVGRLLDPSDAPADCEDCREAILRGNALCSVHWRAFRAWMSSLKPDAYTIWRLGDREDRRTLLKHWRRYVVAEEADDA